MLSRERERETPFPIPAQLDLPAWVGALEPMGAAERENALAVLTREGVTLRQLRTCLTDADLEEVGLDETARKAVWAAAFTKGS
mmetsp:Transcript_10004/g.28687  ORF Transcript_10004/g.28687 Transcript_10004/m.28687 type:complete len:84 (-) Transcript_10004:289-540(-)